MPNSLEARVRRTIQDFNMLSGGEHVLVAVSGGADSTALLLCLHSLASDFRLTLSVAHLNHGIRGPEADADEDFVRRMSADLGLRFLTETVDVRQRARESGKNLEDFARGTRYEFLHRRAREAGAGKIAVGHTLNDQAETILFRFIRGSGIEGLTAIHPVVGGTVIRPLVECPRSSILEYLRHKGSPYRDDSTNSDLKHSRNRMRHEVIPYLENYFNPRVIETLAREARLAREVWSFIESQARESFDHIRKEAEDGITLDINALIKIHPAIQREVCRKALHGCLGSLRGVTTRHIENLLSLAHKGHSGARIQLPHEGLALRQFDMILLQKEARPPGPAYSYNLPVPGKCHVEETGVTFTASAGSAPDPGTVRKMCARQAYLDPSTLPGALTVRTRIPGDRYGGPGHRKVKKVMIDRRIPFAERSSLALVASGRDVIWMPGYPAASAYQVRPESHGCIVITMETGETLK